MKYLLLLVLLSGCGNYVPIDRDPKRKAGLPDSIRKFEDDQVICYTYYQSAISCIRK